MKTYDKVTIYRVTNDSEDTCFHGYTTTSLASRLASLKREADNPRYTTPVHQYINKLGKEHVRIIHVSTLSSVTLDEVKARLVEFTRSVQHTEQHQEQHQEQHTAQHTEQQQEQQQEQHTEQHTAQHQEQHTEQHAEQHTGQHQEQYTEQQYLNYVYDTLYSMSCGAMFVYLERYNIDKLELLRKFNVIEWTLSDASSLAHDKYEATANNISALKKHLQQLYITHTITRSRLTKHEQTVYDQLEQLTQYSVLTLRVADQREASTANLTSLLIPEQFDISDEDDDVNEELSLTTPSYDLTDDKFNVLCGKVKQRDINRLVERYNKTVELEMLLKTQPDDSEAKADHTFFKESLAKRIAELRFDRNLFGLDINCLNLFDSIERDTHISNRLRKKFARYIEYSRKHYQTNE